MEQPNNPQQPAVNRTEYNIDNHRNIIPLNGGHPAFKASFVAKSGGKFKGVIVDQSTLDTAETLQYRDSSTTTEGEWFSGDLEYTDAIPRQFYLVLIADEPTTVMVETVVEPRQPKPKLPPQIPSEPAPVPINQPKTSNKWLVIAIVVILAIVIGAVLMTSSGKMGDGGFSAMNLPNIDEFLASM